MKKLIFSATLISALMLAACGDDATSIQDTNETATTTSTEPAEKESTTKSTEEAKDSNVEENDEMRVENLYTNKELGISGEAGPMKYNISAVQLKKITLKTDSSASLFDAEVGDEIHGFTIAFDGENTSEEDISFYLGQATIITNTKEQLEPDMLLSEHIEGNYLGQVAHDGFNFYVLEKSTVDQLKSIEIRISAPTNSNFDSLSEDIKHIIEVNK